MRVRHEGKACLSSGGVSDRAGGRSSAGRTGRADGSVRSKIWTATIPGAIRKDVCIRETYWAAARDIAERSNLNRFVVILAPLVVIDRRGIPGVVTVGIRITGELG